MELIDRRHAEAAEEDAQFQRHPRYREFRQKVWVRSCKHHDHPSSLSAHTPSHSTQKVHHPDEALPDEANDDLVVMATQDENNLMCPITRKLLVEPVKKYVIHPPRSHIVDFGLFLLAWSPHRSSTSTSPVCGHLYSKEAILAHMKANKRKGTKCPVAGT